ncbi:InlB B-repeat-containing protein [Acholeplasma laidlawii]|nr:InlB B-repeat-containing protein [Acholeplasma laidlawii]NWH10656.1 InlB B-repeat-containing protein [Acholeplasma laidlawii]NWH12041.1 InlB B-repeat-containing protein [Acholeplasma laidlawii]NWH12550.1 InlB B-repeat-containing protein [Acholeplasma laidlawii]NWH14816.1 InlB B-repeat-containing protein [Acholeplasma laidlawii]OAN19354.1 hypothetical protein A2I99_05335 [Acholeplasma laidlawii]
MKKISIFFLALVGLVLIGMHAAPKAAAAGFGNTYSFDVTIVHGESNLDVHKPDLGSFNHGNKVSIDITSLNGLEAVNSKQFAFFVVNGQIIENNLEQFMVTSNSKITAVFTNGEEKAAVFIDSNGEFLSVDYVDGETAPVAPSVANLSKPGLTPVAFGVLDPISEHTVYVVDYVLTNPEATVMINGEAHPYNSVVTLTAEGPFTHWEEDGVVVSYNPNYKFSALRDRIITQKSDGGTPSTIITLSDDLGLRSSEGKSSFLGQFELTAGQEFVESGILASDVFVNNLTIDTPNVQVISSDAIQPNTNEFLRTVDTDAFALIRGYVKTNTGVYYSDNFTPKTNTGLMIYEVYGGGGNSGALYTNDYAVLYNGTSVDIDLSNYTLQYASATGQFTNKDELSGTILAGKYFVVKLGGGSTESDLPRVDFTGTLNLSGTSGKIALVLGTTEVSTNDLYNVVDLVGFGSANKYEGNAAVGVLSNSTSAKRSSFIDSNNNGEDFTVGTPDLTYTLDGEFYTVAFNTDGGNTIYDVEVYENNKVSQPTNPTKPGYVFENWYTSADFTTVFDFNTLINMDTTIYANWLVERTVTFVDGETTLSTLKVANGLKATRPSNPIKSGYAFVDWYEDSEFTILFDFNTEITADKTVYARFDLDDTPVVDTIVSVLKPTDSGYPTSYGNMTWTRDTVTFSGQQLTRNGNGSSTPYVIQGNSNRNPRSNITSSQLPGNLQFVRITLASSGTFAGASAKMYVEVSSTSDFLVSTKYGIGSGYTSNANITLTGHANGTTITNALTLADPTPTTPSIVFNISSDNARFVRIVWESGASYYSSIEFEYNSK